MTDKNESNSPAGDAKASPALRYVVLRHQGISDPHYDLMIETEPGSPLATWRSSEWPIHGRVTLTPLPPHRREYLEYEGPVSGNRGHVVRVALGTARRTGTGLHSWELLLEASESGSRSIRVSRDAAGGETWDAVAT